MLDQSFLLQRSLATLGAQGAWNDATASISQGGTGAVFTTTWCRWARIGRTILVDAAFSFTASAGVAGQPILVVLNAPIAATLHGGATSVRGHFLYAHGSTYYAGVCSLTTGSQVELFSTGQTGGLGAAPSFQTTSGDSLSLQLCYEAAN